MGDWLKMNIKIMKYFPRQVYVREGRRFDGVYFFTAKDALPTASGERPPLHANSVTASHYALDSHAARKGKLGEHTWMDY